MRRTAGEKRREQEKGRGKREKGEQEEVKGEKEDEELEETKKEYRHLWAQWKVMMCMPCPPRFQEQEWADKNK